MGAPRSRLTPRQEAFAREAAKGNVSLTKAAAAAGYGAPHVQGSRLMENVSVAARIAALQDKKDRKRHGAREKAERIIDRAADIILDNLPDSGADSSYALAALKVGADVRDKLPAPESTESPSIAHRAKLYRIAIHACLVGARHPELAEQLAARLELAHRMKP